VARLEAATRPQRRVCVPSTASLRSHATRNEGRTQDRTGGHIRINCCLQVVATPRNTLLNPRSLRTEGGENACVFGPRSKLRRVDLSAGTYVQTPGKEPRGHARCLWPGTFWSDAAGTGTKLGATTALAATRTDVQNGVRGNDLCKTTRDDGVYKGVKHARRGKIGCLSEEGPTCRGGAALTVSQGGKAGSCHASTEASLRAEHCVATVTRDKERGKDSGPHGGTYPHQLLSPSRRNAAQHIAEPSKPPHGRR